MDVRVAAEAARATTRARDAREGDDDDVPEFALEASARRRDDASSSSAWTTSESDDDAGETSCESVDAADVPKWLARARDGANDDDDDDGDDDDDAPPRTRNEIVVDAATPTTPVAAIGSDEAIEAVGRVISVVGRTVVVQSARGEETRGEETDLDGGERDAGRGERAVHGRSARIGRDRGGVWTGERAAVRAAVAGGRDGEDGGRGVRRRRAVEENSRRRQTV